MDLGFCSDFKTINKKSVLNEVRFHTSVLRDNNQRGVFVVDFMHAEERTSHSSGNANPERAC